MGLFRTISEIDSELSWKSQNFSHPMYFTSPQRQSAGFPLELGNGVRGQKTRMMGLPEGQKVLI